MGGDIKRCQIARAYSSAVVYDFLINGSVTEETRVNAATARVLGACGMAEVAELAPVQGVSTAERCLTPHRTG